MSSGRGPITVWMKPGGLDRRRQWVAGLAVGLVITLIASVSLAVVCAAMQDVLLDDLRNYLRRTAEPQPPRSTEIGTSASPIQVRPAPPST